MHAPAARNADMPKITACMIKQRTASLSTGCRAVLDRGHKQPAKSSKVATQGRRGARVVLAWRGASVDVATMDRGIGP